MGKVIRSITAACTLIMLCVYPIAAQTVHEVSAGDGTIQAALDIAVDGDIIELIDDGGLYTNSASDKIGISNIVTIRAKAGLTAKPVVKNTKPDATSARTFEIRAGGSLTLIGLDLDGSALEGMAADNKNIVRSLDFNDPTVPDSFHYYLKIDDCILRNTSQSIIRLHEGSTADSVIITNSIFDNAGREAILTVPSTSTPDAANVGLMDVSNCTFTHIEREALKMAEFDPVVKVNHCTFDSVSNSSYRMIDVRAGVAEVKNSIFTHGVHAESIQLQGAGSSVSYIDTFMVGDLDVPTVGAGIFGVDPLYKDPANGDYTLQAGSPLIGMADDGYSLGDMRWDPLAKVIKVEAGDGTIQDALDMADDGNIIELITSGGLYTNSASDKIGVSKVVTIRAREGLAQKPIVKNTKPDATSARIFEIRAGGSLTLIGLDLDGSALEGMAADNKNIVRSLDFNDPAIPDSFHYYLKIDDCILHNTTQSIIRLHEGSTADSVIITNSIFSNSGREAILTVPSTSTPDAANVGLMDVSNCTFTHIEREALKMAEFDPVVNVNHCTFDSVSNSSYRMIDVRAGVAEVKNSIFTHGVHAEAIQLQGAGSSVSYIDTFMVGDLDAPTIGAGILGVDPLYNDPANGDYRLAAASPVRGAADDGSAMGDLRWEALPSQYYLTIATEGSGLVELDPPGGVYDPGTAVTLTAVPDPEWVFITWSDNVFPPTVSPATITMNANTTVTALFELALNKFHVAVDAIGYGHVEKDPEPLEGGFYYEGEEVTLTAVVDSANWEFAYWTDDAGDSLTNVNPQVFTVAADTGFAALFRSTIAQAAFDLTVVGMGDVDVTPAPVPGFDTYDVGTVITLEADADLGWEFEGYTGDVIDTADSVSFTLDVDKAVAATFAEISHPTGEFLVASADWDMEDVLEYANNNSQVTTIVLTDLGPYVPDEANRDPDNGQMEYLEIESPVTIKAADELTERPVIKGYTSSTGSGSSSGFFRFRAGSGTLVLENLIIDGHLDPDADAYPAKYLLRADDGGDTVFCSLKAYNVEFKNCYEVFWKNYALAMVDTLLFDNCVISDVGKEGLYLKATGHVNFVGLKNTTFTKVARECIYLTAMPDAVVDIDHVSILDCGFGYGTDPDKHGAVRIENTVDVQIRNVIIYKVLNTEYGYALRFAGASSLLDNVLLFESADEISVRDEATVGPDVFWYDPKFLGPDTGNYTLHDSSVAYHLASDESVAIGDLRWATSTSVATYHTFSLTVGDSGAVTLDPEPMAKFYIPGTVVTVTAVPDEGWELSEWGGDLTGSETPTTITMDGDKSITATFTKISTGIEGDQLPTEYSLSQNYPNPFNPTTTIKFALKERGMTTLMVYDILGREIARLVNQELPAGYYEVNLHDQSLASGIYIYRIKSGDFTAVKKMLLVK